MQMSGDATVSPWESGISGFRPAGASNLQLASTFPAEGETKVPWCKGITTLGGRKHVSAAPGQEPC